MIRFDQVSYHYPGGPEVLRDISFHIKEGERVGIIGANGAGKSTLLKAALGLIEVTGEEPSRRDECAPSSPITVGGLPMTRENLPAIRRILGYVLQDSDNQMFMPTVLEDMIFGPMNYGMSRREAEEKADEVLRRLKIEHLKTRQNHKISGGEKRMAAIATILAMEPRAVLMDEPSSSLDPRNRRRLIETLNSLPQTKVIASHDLDLISDTCDRVLLLWNGQIRADGEAGRILRDKELLEECDLELPISLARLI